VFKETMSLVVCYCQSLASLSSMTVKCDTI